MSRFGPRGKYGNRSVGPSSVIDTVRAHPAPAAIKVLTPREREREAAMQGKTGYLTYGEFIADCRNHLDDPVIVGTGLKGAHYTVDEDPRMVRSSIPR